MGMSAQIVPHGGAQRAGALAVHNRHLVQAGHDDGAVEKLFQLRLHLGDRHAAHMQRIGSAADGGPSLGVYAARFLGALISRTSLTFTLSFTARRDGQFPVAPGQGRHDAGAGDSTTSTVSPTRSGRGSSYSVCVSRTGSSSSSSSRSVRRAPCRNPCRRSLKSARPFPGQGRPARRAPPAPAPLRPRRSAGLALDLLEFPFNAPAFPRCFCCALCSISSAAARSAMAASRSRSEARRFFLNLRQDLLKGDAVACQVVAALSIISFFRPAFPEMAKALDRPGIPVIRR